MLAQSTQILTRIFAALRFAQLLVRRHVPALSGLVIFTTSIAGTTMSNYHGPNPPARLRPGQRHPGPLASTDSRGLPRVIEGSLSVTRIHTRPGEVFQLGAILIRNAPCTALFDPLADDSGLGFEGGAGLIGGIIVLMRPRNHIGLNSGTSGPSLVLAGILVILVARATWRQRRAARA